MFQDRVGDEGRSETPLVVSQPLDPPLDGDRTPFVPGLPLGPCSLPSLQSLVPSQSTMFQSAKGRNNDDDNLIDENGYGNSTKRYSIYEQST
jgi:hypothetical protein